jgi:aryl-alcohol dehydrogenase-like predicted oxidoreductase
MNTTLHTPLPRRALGSTGLEVSCLGLGTVKFGRNQGVKYPQRFELPDAARVREVLALCRDAGMNLIDTAPAYGSSEERLGELLTQRQDWVICSKVGEEFTDGVSHFDFTAAHVRRSVERSLRRLRTDYLDLVLIHSDGNDEAILRQGECVEALQRCQEAGLVRALGMSTKTLAGGLLAVAQTDVVMVTLNPASLDDLPVIAHAHALGKGVLIKKALNSGHGDVQSSLEFIYQQAGVTSVIIGSITPAHLQANIAAALRASGEG